MHIEQDNIIKEAKPANAMSASAIIRAVISLSLFIAVDYWLFKSWGAVFLLVSVIVIHELGHFIAMKLFGYQGIRMTFVPFMGAYVSGEADHFSKYKKIILLFAGPLPGILIGMVLLFLYQHHLVQNYYYLAALAFLLLNVFNLFPVTPLDGGQVIETIFPKRSIILEIAFLMIALLVALDFLYQYRVWFTVIIAWLLARRIATDLLVFKVRNLLDKKGIAYDCSYDDLDDDHYAAIRDILVAESSQLAKKFTPGEGSANEGELVSYMEKILVPYYQHGLTRSQQFIFIGIYLLAFLLPFIQWSFFKGWL